LSVLDWLQSKGNVVEGHPLPTCVQHHVVLRSGQLILFMSASQSKSRRVVVNVLVAAAVVGIAVVTKCESKQPRMTSLQHQACFLGLQYCCQSS
jgi:hypothetical protein